VKKHGDRDFVGYGEHPPKIPWPRGARLAISIVVNFEEGAEFAVDDDGRHESLGDIPSSVPHDIRDLNMESMFEYGSRVGAWRLLSVLQRHQVAATFFICGLAAERNPRLAQAIVRDGHEPCGHGYRWRAYHDLSESEQRDDIRRCVASLEKTTGQRPVGWLTRYGPSPVTRRLLFEEGGFLYDSMAFNDDLPYYVSIAGDSAEPWLVVPYSMELNDGRFHRGALLTVDDFEASLNAAFDCLYSEGAATTRMMSIGLHCRIAGTPSRAGILDRFIERVKEKDVWFGRRDEIARWWLENSPPNRMASDPTASI